MTMQSSVRYFLNWATERAEEMDAALATLEGKAGKLHADARTKANEVLADMRKKRDDFRMAIKSQATANEAAWTKAKSQLEAEWNGFEADVDKYIEDFGKEFEQEHATFKGRADAQLKAWHEAVHSLRSASKEVAAQHRGDVEAIVKRMEAEAAAAEAKLRKLGQAGTQSWSVLMGALVETRGAFDRANQAVREAFKKAA